MNKKYKKELKKLRKEHLRQSKKYMRISLGLTLATLLVRVLRLVNFVVFNFSCENNFFVTFVPSGGTHSSIICFLLLCVTLFIYFYYKSYNF